MNAEIIRLKENRVWRTYTGGKELERWAGYAEPKDGDFPEQWVASTVVARNAGRESFEGEGLSIAVIDGKEYLLRDLIKENPRCFLGEKHYERHGDSLAVLVKILDSLWRLSIQVHPDRDFARQSFNSPFGKTEAWYVLGTRIVDEKPPFILLGFKEGITKEHWQDVFNKQNIPEMIDCLHKFTPVPGEVYLVESGVPHAIGSGCFIIEIQEPTDYTLRTEKKTPSGVPINEKMIHQGIGYERLFDCFHYDALTWEEAEKHYKVKPQIVKSYQDSDLTQLIKTEYFEMCRADVAEAFTVETDERFASIIVLRGSGTISGKEAKQGDTFFVPACVKSFDIRGEMSVIICYPGEVR